MNIETPVIQLLTQVEHEAVSRSFRASNELRSAALIVLRGRRSGRRYRVPYTGTSRAVGANGRTRKRKPRYYTASAPGEAPANRTGAYRMSFRPTPTHRKENGVTRVYASVSSDYKVNGKLLGEVLDQGTKEGRIAPRPHRQKIIDKAKPAINQIFSEPYIRR